MVAGIGLVERKTHQPSWAPRRDRRNDRRKSVLYAACEVDFLLLIDGVKLAGTCRLLWQHQTGSGHHSNRESYSVKGKQYVAQQDNWRLSLRPELHKRSSDSVHPGLTHAGRRFESDLGLAVRHRGTSASAPCWPGPAARGTMVRA